MKNVRTKMSVAVTFRYKAGCGNIKTIYEAFERELIKCSRRTARKLSTPKLSIMVKAFA